MTLFLPDPFIFNEWIILIYVISIWFLVSQILKLSVPPPPPTQTLLSLYHRSRHNNPPARPPTPTHSSFRFLCGPDSGGHGPFNLLQWPYRMIFLLLSDMKQSYVMEYKITNLTIIVLSSLFLPPKILFFINQNKRTPFT